MIRLIPIIILLFLLSTGTYASSADFGSIVHIEEIQSLRRNGCVGSIVHGQVDEDSGRIRRVRITYVTPDVHGKPTIASGLIAFDSSDRSKVLKLRYYHHATVVDRYNVPSFASYESSYAVCQLVHKGHVMVAPDLLGLGESPGYHPYLHIQTGISSSVDLLNAAVRFFKKRGQSFAPEMALLGYSAGAHTTLAMHRYFDEGKSKLPLQVALTVAMSGPYELYELGKKPLHIEPKKMNSSLYAAYVVSAYQYVYGDVVSPKTFNEGFGGLLEVMSSQDRKTIYEYLPDYPDELIDNDYFQEVLSVPQHPLNKALVNNTIKAWLPKAEIHFLFSQGDKSVLPQQSRYMAQEIRKKGGKSFLKVISKRLGHRFSYIPALNSAAKILQQKGK